MAGAAWAAAAWDIWRGTFPLGVQNRREQETVMAEQSGAGSSVFTRGFLPGLVLGVVIGAVVGFLSTEILGRTGKIPLDGASPMGTVTERDQEGEPAMTREELERLATEAAAEAAAKAVREQQEGTTEEEPPVEVPSEDPADGRDDG